MTWKGVAAVAAVVAVGGAFLAGYVPEHNLRTDAERRADRFQQQLDAADARVRLARLLGQVLTLKEVAQQQNYGQAQRLASSFFDDIRTEAEGQEGDASRDALNEVLARRDAVTATLTRGDATSVEILHAIELRLRRALDYQVPPEAGAP